MLPIRYIVMASLVALAMSQGPRRMKRFHKYPSAKSGVLCESCYRALGQLDIAFFSNENFHRLTETCTVVSRKYLKKCRIVMRKIKEEFEAPKKHCRQDWNLCECMEICKAPLKAPPSTSYRQLLDTISTNVQ